jgi:CheY-like chemotaxis protein
MTIATDTPHIVLVEDSEDDFETVLEAVRLSGRPANLRRVSNGDECLALLRCGDTSRPTFVMLDLNTSSTDGREALRQIKADPLLKAIPVVVVTTSVNPRDVDFCYQCGANAYHVKPVSYPEHLQMLTGLLDYWLVDVIKPNAHRLAP